MTLLLLIVLLLHSSLGAHADPLFSACEGGDYAGNGNYQSNLDQLLTFFSSVNSSFSTHVSNGSDPAAFGLVLCRGDVGLSDCSTCIQIAAQDLPSLCPNSKQATVWYDNCQLRYSDRKFFSSFNASSRPYILLNLQNATGDFVELETRLLDELVHRAAYNSSLMFATGAATSGSDVQVSALVQCTRDLSRDECGRCLQKVRGSYGGYEVRKGGRVLDQSCSFRYEAYPFYQGKPDVLLYSATPPPPAPAVQPPTATPAGPTARPATATPPPPAPAVQPPTATPAGPTARPATATPAGEGNKCNSKEVLSVVIHLLAVVMLWNFGLA